MPKKETHAEEAAPGKDLTLDEVGKPGAISAAVEDALITDMEMEAFMNQLVEIRVVADGTPGAYDVIAPNVNGINQPIIRGKPQKVKRKYVEALARSRVTAYEQQVPDPRTPDKILMKDITVLTYPFSVISDPDPRGPEWLQAILAQP